MKMIAVIRLVKDMIVEVIELHEILHDEHIIKEIHDAVLHAREIIRKHHKEHVQSRKSLWQRLRRRK